MLFPTVTFALFFAVVLPVSWALMPHQGAWRAWILLASYVFYGWWDWRFVFLLAASTVVNHVLAVAIYRTGPQSARKLLLTLALTFDLGLLAYFKYANFFLSSVDNASAPRCIAQVVLPVGVSFYTFMAISYVVDTYRGELVPRPSRASRSSRRSSRTSSPARSSARASCCRSSSRRATHGASTCRGRSS